jgi:hypothetical protein
VDTHGDVHVATTLDAATGKLLGTSSFPTTPPGYVSLHEWLWSFGTPERVGVESTGSYGAGLTRFLMAEGLKVVEVDRPDRTRAINQFKGLLVSAPDHVRECNQFKGLLVSAPDHVREWLRRLSFTAQLERARRLPDGHGDDVERETRWALKELARRTPS